MTYRYRIVTKKNTLPAPTPNRYRIQGTSAATVGKNIKLLAVPTGPELAVPRGLAGPRGAEFPGEREEERLPLCLMRCSRGATLRPIRYTSCNAGEALPY